MMVHLNRNAKCRLCFSINLSIFDYMVINSLSLSLCIYMCVCVCVCIIQSSQTGVGNNSVRTIKLFNYEHLNLPGKEFNVTDITEQQFLEEK